MRWFLKRDYFLYAQLLQTFLKSNVLVYNLLCDKLSRKDMLVHKFASNIFTLINRMFSLEEIGSFTICKHTNLIMVNGSE